MSVERMAAKIGEDMLKSGAEVFRVEDTVERILKSGGIKNANVLCINSALFISTENETHIIRVKSSDINLYKIDRLNSISRSICEGREIKKHEKDGYSLIINLSAVFIGCFCFCLYFGGSVLNAVFSGLTGIIISRLPRFTNSSFINTFSYSFLSGVIVLLEEKAFSFLDFDKIIIGVVMLFVPGITLSNGIRDVMSSDTLTGSSKLLESLFDALAIAVGLYLSVVILR